MIRESKSMAEIHKIRKRIAVQTKGMTIKQKLAWIDSQAKMLGVPPSREVRQFKKAS